MDENQIKELVRRLHTSDRSQEEADWEQLRPLGASVVPYLAAIYPSMKKLEGRRASIRWRSRGRSPRRSCGGATAPAGRRLRRESLRPGEVILSCLRFAWART